MAFLIQLVSLLALTLWVGGGTAIAFLAAPAVFQRAGSRRLAGEIVGEILRRFDRYVWTAGPIALFCGFLERTGVAGVASRHADLRLALVGGMFALAVFSRLAITPKIRRLRDELGAEIDLLPREDARRKAFGRLHGYSVLCLLGQLALGVGALGLSVPVGG